MTKGYARVSNGETPANSYELCISCPTSAPERPFGPDVGANWRASTSPGVGGVHLPFDEVRDGDGPVLGEELDVFAVVPAGIDPLDDADP